MRKLYFYSTLLFWLLLAWLAWLAAVDSASPDWPSRVADGPSSAGATPPVATTVKNYRLSELAPHQHPEDCWLAIDGQVYDITAYLPHHPAHEGLLAAWCGREASQAYHSKLSGRDHTARADKLLAEYRIGTLEQQ